MPIQEPYYMINFSAAACLFEIRVNDTPVISMNIKGQASTKIPINFAIAKSGVQEVSIKVLPLPGSIKLSPAAELSYSVELYDVTNNKFSFKEEHTEYKSPKVEKEKIIPTITNTTTFKATIPYQLKDYWKEGQELKDIDDLGIKIRNTYARLGKIISDGNYDLFAKKMENREYNMATSMYLSPNESKARVEGLINDFKNGFDFMMIDEKAIAVLSAYGKKVALKTVNGEPALSFGNKELNEQIMLDIEFYLPQNTTEFEII